MQKDNITFKEEFKQSIPILIVAIVFGAIVFCAIYFGSLSYPEYFYEDAVYQRNGKIRKDIKIITIDNYTTALLGDENKWSRLEYAKLINILSSAEKGPSVIAIDVPFSSSKDTSGDAEFVRVCEKAGNVVLSSKITFQGHSYMEDGKQIINPYYADEVTVPYSEVNAVTMNGFSNMIIDRDGYVRYALLKTKTDTGTIDSFAQMIYTVYCQKTGKSLNQVKQNKDGTSLIGYTGKVNSYPQYSMADILSGKISPSEFSDCIVLVGICTDSATDTYKVPIDRRNLMYGVEITANIVQALIDNSFYVYADRLLISLFCGFLATFLLYYTNGKKIRFMSFFLLFFLLLYLFFCEIFRQSGTLLYLIYIPITLIIIFAINIIWKYFYERHEMANELNDMLYSMAEAMTEAVDARTPYNATHTRNVAKLSVSLAEYMNTEHKAGRTDKFLSQEEVEQLHLAALLHDVGKIDVPQDVLDKPTRLGSKDELLYNRLEKLILLYKLDVKEGQKSSDEAIKEITYLESAISKIKELNGKETISDADIRWIVDMGKRCYTSGEGERIPYLNRMEADCLLIPKGTLTESELDLVHEHVIFTNRIIGRIKFGKKYEAVREIAAGHHELLNGGGYPNRLRSNEIGTATRILTIADIYDALVSDNRPYKKAKTKKESFRILHEMADKGEIDRELLRLAEQLWGGTDFEVEEQEENIKESATEDGV